MDMPIINLSFLESKLPAGDFELVQGIVATQGKNKGRLRASKPTLPKKIKIAKPEPSSMFKHVYSYADEAGNKAGMTAYLWRHVAFYVSPLSEHHCMPTLDFCDLPALPHKEQDELEKHLQDIAQIVVDTIPVEKQYGFMAWARVLA